MLEREREREREGETNDWKRRRKRNVHFKWSNIAREKKGPRASVCIGRHGVNERERGSEIEEKRKYERATHQRISISLNGLTFGQKLSKKSRKFSTSSHFSLLNKKGRKKSFVQQTWKRERKYLVRFFCLDGVIEVP